MEKKWTTKWKVVLYRGYMASKPQPCNFKTLNPKLLTERLWLHHHRHRCGRRRLAVERRRDSGAVGLRV